VRFCKALDLVMPEACDQIGALFLIASPDFFMARIHTNGFH
jgi:hypothetical protein